MTPQVDWWAAIVTTDRPESLRELCDDLVRHSREARLGVGVLLVENSSREANRTANRCLVQSLRQQGVVVRVEANPRSGEGIAACRLRLRELARSLRTDPRPRFIWALDDDVRLLHLVWSGGRLEERALHEHVRFLATFGAENPGIDLLIGEVSGDPPIPTSAMLASTLSDLGTSLELMFSRDPEASWVVEPRTLAALREPDVYYDYSVERTRPAWETPVTWLPRHAGRSVADACSELLSESAHLPLGVAITRPILADEARFAQVTEGVRRGANAVFFDSGAFLEHDYPSMSVGGVETRRSDMIGARCLARRRPGRVRTSGFSVLHRRPRDRSWPQPEEVLRGLLADTLGAALARTVDACLAGVGDPRAFLDARVARIDESVKALGATILRIERLASGAPRWVSHRDLEGLRALLDWGKGCLPGVTAGRLPGDVGDLLISPAVESALHERAALIVRGSAA